MWVSDYSWGWRPFHDGRWYLDATYGWVWTPDTVWAPAWVNWRECDGYYGWAPLPPGARFEAGLGFRWHGRHVGVDFEFGLAERDYCIVPAEHFCDVSLSINLLPPKRRTVIYNQTTIIQKNYVYNDNRIINNGPPVEQVRKPPAETSNPSSWWTPR